jgi:cellulose synthase/poly-beta-1,6-N-acetylglucosamine synthase-like glycosyltransferase
MKEWASISAEYLFWGCLALVVYTYFLYPALLFVAYALAQIRRDWQYLTDRQERRVRPVNWEELPPVTLVIAAYNEQDCLAEKIANLRQVDYPQEKLEVIFVSDGSTDHTNEILRDLHDPNSQAIFLSERKGKANALNEAVRHARHGILIFSDASTLFARDTVKTLVRHFSNPRIGGVCGSLHFQRTSETRQTEGLYWKYESMLRLMEGRLGVTLTASGALYALRTCCYRPVMTGTIIEDLVIPMNAQRLGYKVVYDPEAVATEFAASSVVGEFTRRVRLAVGSFRVLAEISRIHPQGFSWLAFISHKLLRWIIPFLLISVLVTNCILLGRPLYNAALVVQVLFYVWAAAGFVFRNRMRRFQFALVGYFLLAMNLAFLIGFFRFVAGRREPTWQRVN